MLKHKTDKKVLFAGINDPKSYDIISKCKIGDKLTLNVGVEEDENSKSTTLEGILKTWNSLMLQMHLSTIMIS